MGLSFNISYWQEIIKMFGMMLIAHLLHYNLDKNPRQT